MNILVLDIATCTGYCVLKITSTEVVLIDDDSDDSDSSSHTNSGGGGGDNNNNEDDDGFIINYISNISHKAKKNITISTKADIFEYGTIQVDTSTKFVGDHCLDLMQQGRQASDCAHCHGRLLFHPTLHQELQAQH